MCLPEKRKVGGSTPPLTTTVDALLWPLTWMFVSWTQPAALSVGDRPIPPMTLVAPEMLHVGCTTVQISSCSEEVCRSRGKRIEATGGWLPASLGDRHWLGGERADREHSLG